MDAKYTLVSLFSGAGGLDMGFENRGFKTIWANDVDKDACDTHRLWSGCEVVHGDIGKVDFESIPEADVIAGGFPCQGFSLAGPRKLDDSRNVLYRYFVKLVEMKKPKVFVAENVKGILTLGNGEVIKAIIDDFSDKGYHVVPTLVNAADYGVPQDRFRVIIVGVRKDLGKQYKFPEKFEKVVSLKEVLGVLPEPDKRDVCWAPFSSRYMSRNRKRSWDQPSFTIPAMAKQVALHPSSVDMVKKGPDVWEFGKGKTRRLSYKEAAVIQTFPYDMFFCGDLVSKYKQIGNAVPVKLAEVVAGSVYELLEGVA